MHKQAQVALINLILRPPTPQEIRQRPNLRRQDRNLHLRGARVDTNTRHASRLTGNLTNLKRALPKGRRVAGGYARRERGVRIMTPEGVDAAGGVDS